jgi:hypothetical protein
MGYKGLVVSDWDKVNIFTKKGQDELTGALNYFMRLPDSPPMKAAAQAFRETGNVGAAIAKLQAFATSGDFPTSVLEVIEKYHLTDYFDTAYEEAFDIRDFTGSRRNGFGITDVESGLTFAKVKEGEKAKIFKVSGTKVEVTFDMYGGGLSWSRRLFDDMEYWTLEDNAIAFRNQAYKSKAQDFYDLIDAVPATYDLVWQAVTGSIPATNENYQAIRDINTINKACENILTRTKDLGFGVSPATRFLVVAPHQLMGRISRALGIVQQPFSSSTPLSTYAIRPVYSLMLADSTKYYVLLPKLKMKGGNRMGLTIFTDFDITAYTDLAVGWQRYGGAIGEIKQLVRCSTA